jgi:hypothetical protein
MTESVPRITMTLPMQPNTLGKTPTLSAIAISVAVLIDTAGVSNQGYYLEQNV